jgi:hypothetical protein
MNQEKKSVIFYRISLSCVVLFVLTGAHFKIQQNSFPQFILFPIPYFLLVL